MTNAWYISKKVQVAILFSKPNKNIEVYRWFGIRDCDTGTHHKGYLYVKFNITTSLLNTLYGDITLAIDATIDRYEKGKIIGFIIKGKNKQEAIQNFIAQYQIL